MTARALLALWLAALPAAAAPAPAPASFALVVGVNRAPEPGVAPLRYADDDAARHQALFRLLGARTLLLAGLDENTARLHPQAAAEARPATRAQLARAAAELAEEAARARRQDVRTVLYLVYAGHGLERDGRLQLTLEDGPLGSAELLAAVDAVRADTTHLVVDACNAHLLAYGRGPGGRRRPLRGFSDAMAPSAREDIGLLLSTSSASETHEWDGLQAGVFSHEIRSGLYGAADADGDGRVSYREIGAFVERANEGIANERFRPRILARAPRTSWQLADLRPALGRRLLVDGSRPGHYVVENEVGERLADFHNPPGEPVRLVRPPAGGPLYVRRVDDATEYAVPPGDEEVVDLARLTPGSPRAGARGAAHDAFQRLFALPFERAQAESWSPAPPPSPPAAPSARTVAGWSALGGGAAAAAGGAWTWYEAAATRRAPADVGQVEVARRNERIRAFNRATTVLLSAGGAAAVLGGVLLSWPAGGDETAGRLVVGPGAFALAGSF